jgi:hypothetical protein
MSFLSKGLLSGNPTRRLFTLWALGLLLCLAAWNAGFVLVPEGALRGVFPGSSVVPDRASPLATLAPILLYNLLFAAGVIVVANLFRVGSFPLGYLPALGHWVLFGLLLGTNSFGVPGTSRLAPSLGHLVRSSGFIELSAYTFIASATVPLAIYRQESLARFRAARFRAWAEVRLSGCERLTAITGGLLIVLAAYRESLSVLLAH